MPPIKGMAQNDFVLMSRRLRDNPTLKDYILQGNKLNKQNCLAETSDMIQ